MSRRTYRDAEAAPGGPHVAPPPQAPPKRNPEGGGSMIGSAIKWMLVISASAVVGAIAVEKYKSWRSDKGDDDDDDDLPVRNAPQQQLMAAPNVLPFPMPFPMPMPTPMYAPSGGGRSRRRDDDEEDLGALLAELREKGDAQKKLERENRKLRKTLETMSDEYED